jgi:hypothetical protein
MSYRIYKHEPTPEQAIQDFAMVIWCGSASPKREEGFTTWPRDRQDSYLRGTALSSKKAAVPMVQVGHSCHLPYPP